MKQVPVALKAHLVSKGWVSANASDEDVRKSAATKLASDELSVDEFGRLSREAPPAGQGMLTKAVADALSAAGVTTPKATEANAPPRYDGLSQSKAQTFDAAGKPVGGDGGNSFLQKSANHIQVKAPSEYYSDERHIGKHKRTGREVLLMGNPVKLVSDRMRAKLGAWFRLKAIRSGYNIRPLDAHEKALIEEMFTTDDFWLDAGQGKDHDLRSGLEVKAILNDATSGGQEIVPYWFDEIPITFPLLHSELLPYVDVRDVARGSSTKSGYIGNPSVSWGTAEGTAISLFNTAALIGAFDTTIYPVVIAVEVGLDEMSDGPMQLGTILERNIGEAALKELDNVIANGNGSSRPLGLFNSTGTTLTSSIAGAAGPLEVADAENLTFAMGKEYRAQNWNPAFVMNDINYARFRGIPVGLNDQRRVFGMDEQSYTLLGYPVRIQNNISNNDAAFVALMKYILYRRKGWDVRTVTEGITLALKNTMVLLGRGRFGGKLSDGAAMAEMNNAPN